MSESLLSPTNSGKSTRVDGAHDLMASPTGDDAVPWMTLAGRDPATTAEQVDRQTAELLNYVQQQNEELDARQAELNAKLAQLDNELRSSRLAGADAGPELTTTEPVDPPVRDGAPPEFEEVQQLVAQIMGKALAADASEAAEAAPENVAEDCVSEAQAPTPLPPAGVGAPVSSVETFPQVVADSHLGRTGIPASQHELAAERRWQAEQRSELARRQTVLQQMESQTHALHREAIEMRYVTEQLWAELCTELTSTEIQQRLALLREKLTENEQARQQALQARQAEVEAAQQAMERQQEEARQQSRKLQDWVEAQHGQLKAYAAEIDARSAMLDDRERRLRDEAAKWEAQRSTQQQQLQSLLTQLNLANLSAT